MAISKKKHVSKKKKISWRKAIDIEDVNKFLEDQRLEERIGKPSEKKDHELFVIDTNQISTDLNNKKHLDKKEIIYEPKCFSMLKSHSQVQDPIKKRNRVRLPEERAHPLALKKRKLRELKRQENTPIKKNLKRRKVVNLPKNDIWTVEDTNELEKNEWLEKDTVRHALTNTGNLKKSVPKSVHIKNSVVPSVEIPHPGTSYNPSLSDHIQLLKDVADIEEKMIKQEKYLNRVTTQMFSKMTEDQKNKAILSELAEGLSIFESSKQQNNDVDSDNSEYQAVNPPARNKKKDRKQRRKIIEQKKLALERKLANIEKRKVSDLHKLRAIENDVQRANKKCEKLREKRLKKKQYAELEPKRLAATKFEKPDLIFNSGEDISGNIRNIKSEGSLLYTCYKSLQKRNILEPGKIRMRKRAKVKKIVKSEHK